MSTQHRSSYVRHLATVAVAVGLLVVFAERDTRILLGTPRDIVHARMAPHFADDGSVKLNVRNEAETSNWSGYVVMNFVTGDTYTAAHASWTVPQVSYQAPAASCHTTQNRHSRSSHQFCSTPAVDTEYSSSWVGIGGTCESQSCRNTDNTLIQLGTEQDVGADGSTQYYAWYEMLPRYPVVIAKSKSCNDASCAYPVKPGDAMTASLACQSNCQPGEQQSWLLTMTDATQNWTFSSLVSYRSTLASAEWIQEAPTGQAGVLPLADFATATFDPTVNGTGNPDFPAGQNGGVGADGIYMVDPYGETSAPSAAAALDVFATCWGNNPNSIASCAAP